jgi:hypothetical protein
MRNPHVHFVITRENTGDDKTLLQAVASNFSFDWYLHVDMDEFLILDSPTIQKYVDSLRNDTNFIQFRWAMIEWFSSNCTSQGLAFMLNRTRVYFNMHMKSMFKGLKNVTLKNHNVAQTAGNRETFRIFRDCAYSKSASPPAIVTRNPCYSKGFLLHVDTRSITNLFTKWLGWHKSDKKSIKTPSDWTALTKTEPYTMTLYDYRKIMKRKIMLFEYHTAAAFPTKFFTFFSALLVPRVKVPFCNSTIEYLDMIRLSKKNIKPHVERLSTLLTNKYEK